MNEAPTLWFNKRDFRKGTWQTSIVHNISNMFYLFHFVKQGSISVTKLLTGYVIRRNPAKVKLSSPTE